MVGSGAFLRKVLRIQGLQRSCLPQMVRTVGNQLPQPVQNVPLLVSGEEGADWEQTSSEGPILKVSQDSFLHKLP